MPPMTPPTSAAGAPPEGAVPMDPAIDKSLNTTMQGLASLYMACHKANPDSPLCDAIMSVQKAVAEIGRTAGSTDDPSMMAEDPNAMPPEGGDPMAEEAMMGGDPMMGGGEDPMADPAMMEPPPEDAMPMAPGASIADAAGETQSMMQNAAKRRLGQ